MTTQFRSISARRKRIMGPSSPIPIERRRYAGGTGSYPLVGRPERIADEMIAMHKLGLAGATISFVNFNEELPFFVDRVLPLLQQAGLRDAAPPKARLP